jgi:hypothetical protein
MATKLEGTSHAKKKKNNANELGKKEGTYLAMSVSIFFE